MTEGRPEPSHRVQAAFGLEGTALQPLPGGEEASVVGGGIVLKQVQNLEVSRWAQGLLSDAQPDDDFRLPRPVQSADGEWEVDGWIATEFVDGLTSLRHDLKQIIRVGESLSNVLTEVLRGDPVVVRQRQDRWARADRFAWGEEEIDLTAEASDLVSSLRDRMSYKHESRVIVHGDLSGNVFADRSGSPVVLDFTPYVRPKRYASAIVVGDNILWWGGGPELAELISDDDGLARALLFRMVSEQLASNPRHGADLADSRRAIATLGWV